MKLNNMDINWLREEVAKNQEDINWIGVIEAAGLLYKETKVSSSFLGITKGFVNLVKVSYSFYGREISKEIRKIYPSSKVFEVNSQSNVIKLIKDMGWDNDKQYITDNLVIIISDKNTLETAFNRYKVPFIKYIASTGSKRLNGETKYRTFFRWRKDGEKGIKWEEGQGASIKRDSILDELFEE